MTAIRYRDLGAHRRLSSIVFAGSHDASITRGSKNAQTQTLDIAGQANAGVRLFDLRILAMGNKTDGMSLVGYHGKGSKAKSTSMVSSHTGKSHDLKYSKKMTMGTTGEKLSDMLAQAKAFVEATNEFLIFKFDKCKNWELIAEYCVSILGDALYKPSYGQELGERSLDELGGKVICVFSHTGLLEIRGYGDRDGILGFRNLKGDDGPLPYKARYTGLQYYGKGGTNPFHVWRTSKGKLKDNEKKQAKMMAKMAVSPHENSESVLGMMYWTTTGLTQSIETRNDGMWKNSGVNRLAELWSNGLEKSIAHQLTASEITYVQDPRLGERMRAFFPNIIMVDFADTDKCGTIYALNKIAEQRLTEAFRQYVA